MRPVPVILSLALSLPATASASLPNTPPTVPALSTAHTAEDEAVEIRFEAEDLEGDALTFDVVFSPGSGELRGDGATRVFIPDRNFTGRTWMAYTASDGEYTSDLAWLAIDVAPTQDEVWPRDVAVAVAEDGVVTFELEADADPGVRVVWEVLEAPAHGAIDGEAAAWVSDDATLVYTPDPDYTGSDRVVVAAYDAGSPRAFVAVVSIDVAPRPDAPGGVVPVSPAPAAVVTTVHPTLRWSVAEDPDGDALRYGARVLDARTQEVVAAVDGRVADGAMVSWTVPEALAHGRVYAWEAWADDGGSTGPVSTRTLFRVDPDNAAPAEVVITTPVEGELVPMSSPVFVFDGAEDPDGGDVTYELEIDTSPTFDTPAFAAATRTASTPTVVWDLAEDGIALPRYSEAWGRVRAVDGEGLASDWSVVAFRVAGPNLAPAIPTVEPIPQDPDTPCLWRLTAEDPEADRVAYEVTVHPDLPAERSDYYGMNAPSAVVKCTTDDRGVASGWVRAVDEYGAASPWRRVEADLRVGAGCAVLPASTVGWLPLLVALGVRRRR